MNTETPTTKSSQAASELLKNCSPSHEERLELASALDDLKNAVDDIRWATPERVYGSGAPIVLLASLCSFPRSLIDELAGDNSNPEALDDALVWYFRQIAYFVGLRWGPDHAALQALLGATYPDGCAHCIPGPNTVDLDSVLEDRQLAARDRDYRPSVVSYFASHDSLPDPSDRECVDQCVEALQLLSEVGRYLPPFALADALSAATLTAAEDYAVLHGVPRLGAVVSRIITTNRDVCPFYELSCEVLRGIQQAETATEAELHAV